jgi:hypothetical protein
LIEIIIKIESSVLALANLFVFVKDEGKMASNGAFVDQREAPFLDKGS